MAKAAMRSRPADPFPTIPHLFAPLPAAVLACLLLGSACGRAPLEPAVGPFPSIDAEANFQLPAHPPAIHDLQQALARLEQDPASGESRRDLGIVYQMLSLPDRWHYLDAAREQLSAAREALPSDPLTLMYLGLVTAGKAKDPDTHLFRKLGMAREGFAYMDQALALAPTNFSFRLLRARAQTLAPPIVGRNDDLKEDVRWLETRLENAGSDTLPRHLTALGWMVLGDYRGTVLQDAEGAERYWRRVVDLAPDLPVGEMAAARLSGKRSAF